MLKPQLKFDPPVDNSYFQFVPIIKEKYNQITELDITIIELQRIQKEYILKNPLKIRFEDKECVKKLPHPYSDEIQKFKISDKLVEEVANLEPEQYPEFDKTPFLYVDNSQSL